MGQESKRTQNARYNLEHAKSFDKHHGYRRARRASRAIMTILLIPTRSHCARKHKIAMYCAVTLWLAGLSSPCTRAQGKTLL